MKIKKIIIKNFKTIENLTYEPHQKVNIRTGKNGVGKTSFLQAVRYGLTGEMPDEAIKNGETEMSVYVELDDDTNFERINKDGMGIIKVNGKRTTGKALNELLQLKTGISQPVMKITSSAELSSSLKPDELGTLLLSYIPDEQDIDSVISFMTDIPTEIQNSVISEMSMLLPPIPNKFGTETINDAYSTAFSIRKDIKKERDMSIARISSFIGECPKENKEDLQKELENLIKIEGSQEAYNISLKTYENAVENKKKQTEQIKSLEDKIAINKSLKPNPVKFDEINSQLSEISKKKTGIVKIIQTLKNDMDFLKKTIENLDKPICPLSEKLTCSTDKTKVKAELEELLISNQEGLSYQEQALENLIVQEKEEEEKKQIYLNNQSEYKEKIILIEQLNKIKNNIISIPQKPTVVNVPKDISTEKKRIENALERLNKYEEHVKEKARCEALEKKVSIYDFIVKSLAPKGSVMEGIIGYYLPLFETACNQKANTLKSGFNINLVYDDGILITCETTPGSGYRTYNSLSNGEKIFIQFLLLDMLNSLTGFNVLILDSLDQLDKESFKSMVDLISDKTTQDEYDHIFIAAVDHDDTINILNTIQNIEWVKL